jgi:hypothetical protein
MSLNKKRGIIMAKVKNGGELVCCGKPMDKIKGGN